MRNGATTRLAKPVTETGGRLTSRSVVNVMHIGIGNLKLEKLGPQQWVFLFLAARARMTTRSCFPCLHVWAYPDNAPCKSNHEERRSSDSSSGYCSGKGRHLVSGQQLQSLGYCKIRAASSRFLSSGRSRLAGTCQRRPLQRSWTVGRGRVNR